MVDDAKLAEARRRVSKAERKALDRAMALRDEAVSLLEAAKAQATRIRDDAKAEAARTRQAAADEAVADDGERARLTGELQTRQAELTDLRAELAVARASAVPADEWGRVRAERDRLQGELTAAKAERDRIAVELAEARAQLAELCAPLTGDTGDASDPGAAADAQAGNGKAVVEADLLALVALVESVEAERDALAAEVERLRSSS